MDQKERRFWNDVLKLAKSRISKPAYEYFVSEARLINIHQRIATILLDSNIKQLFWEKNLADIILTVGFEVFDTKISEKYVFNEDDINFKFSNKNEKIGEVIPHPSVLKTKTKNLQQQTFRSGIQLRYTFDNFIQGEGNQWAKAASLAVSDNLGGIYNPLFIYGGPGLGKTHLLNAIGNEILTNMPDAYIKYIPAETFINEFLGHMRLNNMETFKKTYRSLDLLLIDDIQVFKKGSTQEEFFNTFNSLHNNNKQIVLTSDRSPDHLDNLEERLVTRFKWGLTSDITPPDFETRIAILQNKIQNLDYQFTNDSIEYLAGQFNSNIRELEGALKDIDLLVTVRKIKKVTVDVTAEAIRSRKKEQNQNLVIPIEKIQKIVGNFYGVSTKEIKGNRRVQNIVLARQVAMYLVRELTDNSLPKIGREFGGKDHTTVIHAHNKIRNMLETDDNLQLEIYTIKNKIK